jgi:hypothetical protein
MNYDFSHLRQREVERLAYRLWEERGRPAGSPHIDWFQAEQLLRKRDSPMRLPFSSILMGPVEN